MSNRWIAALILVVTVPAAAAAQFTTFIAPPSPVKDSIKAVVAEQKAVTDSMTKMQIADMKTWVDSASGIVVPKADTAMATQVVAATSVSNGLVAPATASPLPVILLLGSAGMMFGLLLMRRPRPKPHRIDNR